MLKIVVLVFLSGCAPHLITPTSSPILGVIPTIQASNVPTNTATSQVGNSFTIHSYCPESSHDEGLRSDLTGTIVLGGEKISLGDQVFSPDQNGKSILLFWDTASDEKTLYQLPEHQEYYYYVTSLDKKRLAFTEGKTLSMPSDVIVLNHDGKENGKFALPDDWNLFDWLNNEVSLVRQTRLQKDKNELVAVNPVNGKQQVLPADFPNLYSRETVVTWGALTIFDPSASRALYPKLEKNQVVSILWDVDNNKEIARIVGDDQPKWSPDGKQLLIIADYKPTDF